MTLRTVTFKWKCKERYPLVVYLLIKQTKETLTSIMSRPTKEQAHGNLPVLPMASPPLAEVDTTNRDLDDSSYHAKTGFNFVLLFIYLKDETCSLKDETVACRKSFVL